MALAQELDQRRAAEEPGDPHQVRDVVAVQPVARRRDEVVGAALRQLVGAEHRGPRRVDLALGHEFEVVRPDVEHAGGGEVLERQRHPALAGQQPEVADRRLAVVPRQLPQVGAHAPAGPGVDDDAVGRPHVLRVEPAELLREGRQLRGPPRVLPQPGDQHGPQLR